MSYPLPSGGISLRADLNNEDDGGLSWSLLANARDRSEIVEGASVVAGTEGFWSWVEIRRIDPDGQVHFEQLTPDSGSRAEGK